MNAARTPFINPLKVFSVDVGVAAFVTAAGEAVEGLGLLGGEEMVLAGLVTGAGEDPFAR